MMKFIKKTRKKMARLILAFSQIFGREFYINILCFVYDGGVVFNDKRKPRYISPDVSFDDSDLIYVGGGTTIAAGTIVLTHDYSIDYGLQVISYEKDHEIRFCKEVHIGNDTFIGQGCIILPGVRIGNNCIIGAGSIVTRDIPDMSVAAGSPAKVLCSTEDWIKKRIKKDSMYFK